MKNLFLILALSPVALAQTSGGITAPASRTVTFDADEAAFTIAVAADLESTQQQVKQALQNAGLPNPTVVALGLGTETLQWFADTSARTLYSATVTIAAGSALDTARRLEDLRDHLQAPLRSLQYSIAFNASQAKVDAMRAELLPQLMDESRRLAQSLVSAAGLKLGAVRSVSDTGGIGGVGIAVAPYAYVSLGGFLLGNSFPAQTGTQVTFNLNVVYATVP